MVAILLFRPRRKLWYFPKEENGRSWYEARAINAGYLSGDMLVEHRCRYNWGLEGETYCHICAKWVRESDSEKCYCSLREETLSMCDSWRKALAKGKKHLWSLGAQPGKLVWQPYDNLEKV